MRTPSLSEERITWGISCLGLPFVDREFFLPSILALLVDPCVREELRRRFVKAETTLFRVRYDSDDTSEKEEFLNSRDFDWIAVSSFS